MRKPNGYGSIKKLSGNRRRPFVFVISVHGKQKPVEYFSTQVEAEIFQADYNKLHFHQSRLQLITKLAIRILEMVKIKCLGC
nr:MAG TPA: cytochrome oxidase subunit [Caudoviricetes sp.]